MTLEVVEITKVHLLQEQVQSVVLLESKGTDTVIEHVKESVQVVESKATILEVPVLETVLLSEAEQGPPGPPGLPGVPSGLIIQRKAGQDTSALVAVYEDMFGAVWPADPEKEGDVLALLGVTLSAAEQEQAVNVQRFGFVDDANWNWQLGRVYLGAQGCLTQIPPCTGHDVLIGNAVSPTRLLLNIQDPIELE